MATLLSNEDEHELTPQHLRKSSKPVLDEKTFNIGLLSAPRHESRNTLHRKMSEDLSDSTVPYKETVDYIKVNPEFMIKEELLSVKMFPLREWLVFKNKSTRVNMDTMKVEQPAEKWRIIVFIMIIIAIVFISVFFYIVIKSLVTNT